VLFLAFFERASCGSGLSQVERHEDTVRVEHIIGEGRALHEPMAPIKCLRRPKIFPGARLEAEARHASYSSGRNDVAQHRASHSPSAHGLSGIHGLDLTMIGRESFQRADPQERFIVPDRPKADVGRLQPGEIQRVRATRGRFGPGTGQMGMQEIDNARVAQAAFDDPHHGSLIPTTLRRGRRRSVVRPAALSVSQSSAQKLLIAAVISSRVNLPSDH
jgi:hypothetical protein